MIGPFLPFMDLMSDSSSLFPAKSEIIQSGPVSTPVRGAIASALDSLSICMELDFECIFTKLEIILTCCDTGSSGWMEKMRMLYVYQRAIKMLRLCYADEAKPGNKGFSIAFSSLTGLVFISAFPISEPLALYIALQWVVLLHGLESRLANWPLCIFL